MFGRKKVNLSEKQREKCQKIIHAAAAAAGAAGTGLAQIPLADNAVITPIQIGMIIKLGHELGCDINETVAKGIISGAGAAFIGRGVSQALWGWIPVAGNAINTATAAGLTEAIGWMAVKEFSTKKSKYTAEAEEARKKAEEEARKKAEEEARKRAEEEADKNKGEEENSNSSTWTNKL